MPLTLRTNSLENHHATKDSQPLAQGIKPQASRHITKSEAKGHGHNKVRWWVGDDKMSALTPKGRHQQEEDRLHCQ